MLRIPMFRPDLDGERRRIEPGTQPSVEGEMRPRRWWGLSISAAVYAKRRLLDRVFGAARRG